MCEREEEKVSELKADRGERGHGQLPEVTTGVKDQPVLMRRDVPRWDQVTGGPDPNRHYLMC